MEFSAKQIAEVIGGVVEGDENITINTFAKIEEGHLGAISFLSNPKYTPYIYTTKSSIVLVNKDLQLEHPVEATLIRVENAYESVAQLLSIYQASLPKKTGIDKLAYVSPTAKLGDRVYVAPFVYIGDHVVVGDDTAIHAHTTLEDGVKVGDECTLYANVTVYQGCKVGNRCVLHAGTVIGADGFGFAPTPEGYNKIPQIGIAVLEDDVEIGANSCVDRATMGATIVRQGAKIDNLVQVAHNVEVGSNTVLCAQVGIAGSTKIGEWCMLGGQVGVAGHAKIGHQVKAAAQTGIAGNLKDHAMVMGSPAIDHKNAARSAVGYKHLPEMMRKLNALEKEIAELKKK
jgi:UDP-3-O-[3-hydroxymyristoyl] glucosamine N-acyltransferase